MGPPEGLDGELDRREGVLDLVGDAPVLAAADASIALDAGTALARASADAVSLGTGLGAIVTAIGVAAQTRRIIRQNIACRITSYNVCYTKLLREFVYDRPFQFGSKRTGPDLARVGKRYSDDWHRIHLVNPRDVVPESNMRNNFV